MSKNFILRCICILFVLPAAAVVAKENKPIEAFIEHVKEANRFVPISNIWQPDNSFDRSALLKNVGHVQPLTVDYGNVASFLDQKNTAINLIVPGIDGGTFTIELARFDFLTNDFQVHEMGADNTDKLVSYTPGLYYRGVVAGIPGSVAAFSFFKNEIYGTFSIPGVGNYVLVPNTMVGKEYDYNQHYVLYNDNELTMPQQGPRCATDELPTLKNPFAKTTTTLNNNIFNSCTEVRCFETCDNAMYVKKGSTTTAATNYITALFNNKSTIYRNEGVMIELRYLQINTAADQYGTLPASSGRWLNKFGWVTQTTMHGCDVATLFTTKYGSMGGVAWLGTMCAGYYASDSAGPYAFCNLNNNTTTTSTAFPTYSWDVEVSAHEMGHVLGSPHTHACVWNPPARNTAIDKCYTLEGSCATPSPMYPTAGGTIMSYCHLVSGVGINFSNGFGSQPGDTVRYFINNHFSASCGEVYNPAIAPQIAARVKTANRECTDASNVTYYWNDNNTASHADDTLVLMINKGTANIGNLNTTGFSVKAGTLAGYGGGTGQTITFPTGVPGIQTNSVAMRRYWQVTPVTEATTELEVIFPFMKADTADVDGSVPGVPQLYDYRFYKTEVDPTPGGGFTGGLASNFHIYTYNAATPSATKWSLSTTGTGGTTYLAHMKMTKLTGGGTGFYTYNTAAVNGVENVNADAGINVYPNPTHDEWFVSVDRNNNDVMTFQLFTADGRMVQTKVLQNGTVNAISAKDLAMGIYYYRIIGGNNVYTGNMVKN